MYKLPLAGAALAFALVSLPAPAATHPQAGSQTAMAGTYSVTLRLMPAASFAGPRATMAWDGGAKPRPVTAPDRPDRRLVAFVTKHGKDVTDALVAIRYRELAPRRGDWTSLSVARMHVAGAGPDTTQFGNNVRLVAGDYEVYVTVNASPPAIFYFPVPD